MSGFEYTVRELEAWVSTEDYLQDCVDVPKFYAFCRACKNYGVTWSCPPFAFDPMDLWHRYRTLRLYARMLVPNYPGQDIQAAISALRKEKDASWKKLLGWESETPGSLALSAGFCSLCDSCARTSGEPCRAPERMRYSLEALGGDVGLSAEKYLGQPLLWIQNGNLPKHLMLVGALLLSDGKAGCTIESLL
ncbi:MAG: DUF2284 domain-containing protein [Oscillospiraceae bacterium]|jgi:predicted metal-binding protein|nr:DUF2284 domain-containing protein [Oscillospiraceae bacterium]